jgi:NAD(P)-dependent dehydrogenase (short-subunit alcohol dehydrogenase family)
MAGNERRVAFVTGGSRGVGKGIAVELAKAGYDVAIASRTMQEGEAREHSSTLKKSDTRPLPGSNQSTVELIESQGGRAFPVYLDLLDKASLGFAVATVLERHGRIDVLVNNARYIGPGHMDRFYDTPVDIIDRPLQANALAPLILTKLVIDQMIERGEGAVINITSGAALVDPTLPVGQGGWGLGYGMSKAALNRVAGHLATEFRDRNVMFYNVDPGFTTTERMVMDMADFGFDADVGAPPEVTGAVCAWLLTSPEAPALAGTFISAQEFCHERNLVPGWAGPNTNRGGVKGATT